MKPTPEHKKKWLKHRWLAIAISVCIVDGCFFSGTNPNRVPSWVLVIGFCIVIINSYVLIRLLCRLAGWYGLPVRHQRRLAAIMTIVVAMFVALISVNEFSSRDALVLIPLAVVGYLYVSYMRPHRKKS